MTTTFDTENPEIAVKNHTPGEGGIWVFVYGEMLIFSVLFLIFAIGRAGNIALFAESQTHLSQGFGFLNTFFMLTSSLFVAGAVRAARQNEAAVVKRGFSLALLLGAAFVVVKFFEWTDNIHNGMTLGTNYFFTLYYMLTGIHLLHVLIGLCVLSIMIRYSASGNFDAKKVSYIESAASFWHLVDLLWIVLFALIYLIK